MITADNKYMNKKIMVNNNKGFTLIEIIVTLAIITLIFAMIIPLFVTGVDFFAKSNGMVMDQVNLRKTITDMSREIRDASSITIVSATEINLGNCVYEYLEDTNQITKYFPDTDSTTVVSERVALFEVIQNDDLIEIRVKAEGPGSTIVTKVSVRENQELQSPPIA